MLMIPAGLFTALVCFDLGTKQYVEDNLKQNEERETLAGRVVLRKVYNEGFLLGTLKEYPALVKGASAAAGAVVLLYDIWLFFRKGQWAKKLGMVFVSAGTAGNLYDRLVRGRVVDYIGVKCKNKYISRLTANLADAYVVIGLLLWGTR